MMGTQPSSHKGVKPLPNFGPFLLWPNGWMHQDATWYGDMPQPKGLCVRWGPSPPIPKKEAEPGGEAPQFSAHVYCGQTAGWIKMALGMEVGISPFQIVLDGDPAPLPKKGGRARPIFGPSLLWPNGCMDEDATWYGGRPRPTQHCVRCGPSYPQKKGTLAPTQFWPICLLWPNGWMDEDAAWYGSRPRPRPHCTRRGTSSSEKGTTAPPHLFGPCLFLILILL